MEKYKVGDKVRIVDKWKYGCCQNLEGKMDKWLGKVMTIRTCIYPSAWQMEEDKEENQGTGWYWTAQSIAGLAETENKIVITTDGSTTTARLYDGKKVVNFASAQCHEDDVFDFNTGATIAFDRLLGREPYREITAQPPRKPQYKIGERIRVVRFTTTYPGACRENYTGSVFTIKSVYKNAYTRGVAYSVGKTFVVYEDEIETAGYTGRAVCVLSGMGCDKAFTLGRIYTFVDKETVDDHGNKKLFKREDDIYIGDGVEKFIKIKE